MPNPTPLNQQALVVAQIKNNYIPTEGPKAVPFLLDFTGLVGQYSLDLELFQSKSFLSMVQTLYLDLNGSPNNLLVQIGSGSGQNILAKPNTQGYYPVLCPNPPTYTFTSTPGGIIIPVFLINVPIAGVVWA